MKVASFAVALLCPSMLLSSSNGIADDSATHNLLTQGESVEVVENEAVLDLPTQPMSLPLADGSVNSLSNSEDKSEEDIDTVTGLTVVHTPLGSRKPHLWEPFVQSEAMSWWNFTNLESQELVESTIMVHESDEAATRIRPAEAEEIGVLEVSKTIPTSRSGKIVNPGSASSPLIVASSIMLLGLTFGFYGTGLVICLTRLKVARHAS
ncbi:MAG: hypothetical protein RH917_08475 [Lacipirellulaceae bacterium]